MRVVLGAATALILTLATAPLVAQWPSYPNSPNIPKLPDGKVDLKAPAPRTADGKPDLRESGCRFRSTGEMAQLTPANLACAGNQ